MLTAMRKIHKDKGAAPDALEEAVAKAFFDIETNNVDLQVGQNDDKYALAFAQ